MVTVATKRELLETFVGATIRFDRRAATAAAVPVQESLPEDDARVEDCGAFAAASGTDVIGREGAGILRPDER